MIKKALKWVWGIVEIIVIFYVIFMTAYILCRNKYGFTQIDKFTFVTLNEENCKFIPEYNDGDLLVIKSKKYGIKEGSVIYYYVTVNEEYVVRSGVVKSKAEDEYSSLYYLNDEDNTSVSSNRVLGKDVAVYSKMGAILEFLEGRIGFLLCVLLPIMLIFIYRIYDLFVVSKYRNNEDEVETETTLESDNISKIEEQNNVSVVLQNTLVSNGGSSTGENISSIPAVENAPNSQVISEVSVLQQNVNQTNLDNKNGFNNLNLNDTLILNTSVFPSDQTTIDNREIKPIVVEPMNQSVESVNNATNSVLENSDIIPQAIPSVKKEEEVPQIIDTIPTNNLEKEEMEVL